MQSHGTLDENSPCDKFDASSHNSVNSAQMHRRSSILLPNNWLSIFADVYEWIMYDLIATSTRIIAINLLPTIALHSG
ncbi:hypothetical protein ACTXT7_006521 [Hymenolepis weldensis]